MGLYNIPIQIECEKVKVKFCYDVIQSLKKWKDSFEKIFKNSISMIENIHYNK